MNGYMPKETFKELSTESKMSVLYDLLFDHLTSIQKWQEHCIEECKLAKQTCLTRFRRLELAILTLFGCVLLFFDSESIREFVFKWFRVLF